MSPQEHTYNRKDLDELAEREARAMLGVSWHQAHEMLNDGALRGTAAEAEIRMLQFLMEP